MAMSAVYTNFCGMIVSETRSGVERDYVPDTLGSTAALVDNTEAVTDRWEYWPYGEVSQRTGASATPFTFVGMLGYFKDLVDKLLYVRARHLRVDLARWLTSDPLTPRAAPYRYCEDSPPRYNDPSGLLYELVIRVPRPVGITQSQWDAIIKYLIALGIPELEIIAILGALAALVLLMGFTCAQFARLRYQICASEDYPGRGNRTCLPGDSCWGTLERASEWGQCAAIQLMLNAVCHPQGTHKQAFLDYLRHFTECSALISVNCDPFGVFRSRTAIRQCHLTAET